MTEPVHGVEGMLAWIRAHSGEGEPGPSQHDELTITHRLPREGGGERVAFRYFFDQDHCSQYDKTVSFAGDLLVTATGEVISGSLRLTARGEAALP